MARKREFDPAQALDKAMALFWDKGYADTTMDDLVDVTGVSRYGLYGTFGNKRELFTAALDRYAAQMALQRQTALRRPGAGLAEIRRFFDGIVQMVGTPTAKRGCMLCNTATEVAAHDAGIARTVRGHLDDLANAFAQALQNARDNGDLDASVDPARTARCLTGLMQGGAVMIRAGYDRNYLKRYFVTALDALL